MIELFTARSGATSVKVDGVAMHSPYDPVREADRFAREAIGDEPPATVVVLGECAGHITEAVARLLARRSPPCRRLLPGNRPGSAASRCTRVASGRPALVRGIPAEPSRRAADRGAADRRVAPRGECIPRRFEGRERGRPASRAGAERKLHHHRGRRPPMAAQQPGELPAPAECRLRTPVRAGPPHRHRCSRAVTGRRRDPFLRKSAPRWSSGPCPSSCVFLKESGLLPDLVVMTDPGFYSMHHLHFAPPPCPVAMPLSAARGAWDLPWGTPQGVPVFLLGQPVIFEKALLDAAGVSAPMIPPRGTVAATAIELALAATSGPVIVAGLDMCSRDLLMHARPSAFDRLLLLQASRLQPHTSLVFHRAAEGGFPGCRSLAPPGTAALPGCACRRPCARMPVGSTRHRPARTEESIGSCRPLFRWPEWAPWMQKGLPVSSTVCPPRVAARASSRIPVSRTVTSGSGWRPRLLAEWTKEVAAARDSVAGGSPGWPGGSRPVSPCARVRPPAVAPPPRRRHEEVAARRWRGCPGSRGGDARGLRPGARRAQGENPCLSQPRHGRWKETCRLSPFASRRSRTRSAGRCRIRGSSSRPPATAWSSRDSDPAKEPCRFTHSTTRAGESGKIRRVVPGSGAWSWAVSEPAITFPPCWSTPASAPWW